jgi:hypothetical protein
MTRSRSLVNVVEYCVLSTMVGVAAVITCQPLIGRFGHFAGRLAAALQ